MAEFIVRVYSPFDNAIVDYRVEASSVQDARKKSLGQKVVSPIQPFPEFEIENEFIIDVFAVPEFIRERRVQVNLKYEEFMFKEYVEADTFARSIERSAVEGPSEYIFSYGGRMMRGVVYRAPDPRITKAIEMSYWVVKRPVRRRKVDVWRIAIPGFSLCALMDGRRAKHIFRCPEGFRFNGDDIGGQVLQVCDYHMAADIPKVSIQDKIFDIPDGVCAFYCPQGLYYSSYDKYTSKTVWYAYCRAYMPVVSDYERKKRGRRYRGMRFLCLEDEWWQFWWGKPLGKTGQ